MNRQDTKNAKTEMGSPSLGGLGGLAVRPLVFFVHGIRNSADNYGEIIARWLASRSLPVYFEGIDWGWISGVQMWLAHFIPFAEARRRARVAKQIREARECFGKATPVSIIAHSKGTDLTVDTLWASPDIILDALVLVGSVLSNKFDGSRLQALIQRGQVNRVLVVWSLNDSIIRNLSIWPYGKLGATGFVDLPESQLVSVSVFQSESTEEHSTYFWSEFRDRHFAQWFAFILDGKSEADQ
jgi:hypothetical protein